MKGMKRFLALALALCLGAWLSCGALAAETAEGYTYTVRFFAGQQGSIQGKEVISFQNLKYGEQVTFNRGDVKLKNGSKYYVKGIRESGKDNNTVSMTSFPVTGDQDYVVAYGVLGNAVAYTVNYVDGATGNALAPSETYYGNVGDKPVIAYVYVDGYQPQAYNLTKTLSENATDNVFTFTYTAIGAAGAPAEGEAAGGGAPAAPGAPAAGGAAAGAGGAAAGGAGAGAGGVAVPDGGVPAAGPEDMVDLDNPDVPQANLDGDDGEATVGLEDFAVPLGNLPLPAKVGLAAGALAVLGGGLWFLLVYKRKKKEEKA